MKSFLFKPDMVAQILFGKKTQTRRMHARARFKVGELAYVKHTWYLYEPPAYISEAGRCAWDPFSRALRFPDGSTAPFSEDEMRRDLGYWQKRSPLFMPEWASFIQIRILSVRAQRLQDISESDALAEGVDPTPVATPREAFEYLWDSINRFPNTWVENPRLIAYGFERVKP